MYLGRVRGLALRGAVMGIYPTAPEALDVEGIGYVPAQHRPLWWQARGLSYTASGYGSKIPTSRMVRVDERWYRVYCMIWSNAGTCYIIRKGDRVIVCD